MSHTQTERSFFKDLQELYKKLEASTEGQSSIICVDDMKIMLSLQPQSGLYAHAVFHMTVGLFFFRLHFMNILFLKKILQ